MLFETGEPLLVVSEARRQHLDRDLSADLRVAGEVNLTHAARTDQRLDLVPAKLCS